MQKKARPIGVRSAAAVSNGKMLEFVVSFTQKIITENLANLHSSLLTLHIWESGNSCVIPEKPLSKLTRSKSNQG